MASPAIKHRVSVVDDEHVIATTLAMILCSWGFDAKPYTDPQQALQAARSESPDLLLTDVVMPRLTGVDLAIQVKQQCPNCKVLLVSGQPDTIKLNESARAEGHDFELLMKPVHPSDLRAKIQSAFHFVP